MKYSHIGVCGVVLAGVFLSGCAVKNDKTEVGAIGLSYHSNVEKLADGNYVASVEASLGRGRVSGAQGLVARDAIAYCNAMNKNMKVIKEETDSHLLVNGVAKLTFSCIQ
ncbi:Uncharacterised protein [Serratia fonticola]|jgi:hypothetical protein|uniref:Lipoprotein n=1 Tax=Serratia fonticola TaxID=47917 RepID=A0AAE7JUM5_SERFO|nr:MULTISPECIES: hypothetical protein [Serratia]ATM74881.1 hypothetical protein CRN79_03035 [Serratia fonticola]MBC3227082.1 hypothetical protein [Serratia fonticola]MCO7512484.1 hypothetical protein [Serratia fonticola]NBJ36313.1 hypothetical protein [Serratia fonticola]OCJ22697.1 hypothetical protein A6U95_12970 [Serratia sp. 14-2641]